MTRVPELHRQIAESSLDGLWVVDVRGRTLFANRRAAELLGRSEEEMAGIAVVDVLPEGDRQAFEAHLRELHGDRRERRAVDRVFLRPDGASVELSVTESVLYDDDGQPFGYAHRLTDETRRRSLVADLTRSRSQLAEAQAIARIGSWEIQVEPREITWSDQMYTLLDVDPETFVAGPEAFLGQVVEEDRPLMAAHWAQLAIDPRERSVDARVRLRDGSERWVRTVGRVLECGPDGTPVRFGGTVQDINDLKQTELHLLDAVEVNVLMQFMATAANETSTLDAALTRLRRLLLADEDWIRGTAFTVVGERLDWRRLSDSDPRPTGTERQVAVQALAKGAAVFDEDSEPGRVVVGFPVAVDGVPAVVVVITARSSLRHRAALESLLAQVAAQLAHVAARELLVAELTRSRSQLADAQEIASLGSWEIQIEPWEVTWSRQMYELLDADAETVVPGLDEFLGQFAEEDRPLIEEEWARLAVEPGERTIDARVRSRDGSVRWVRTLGRVLETADDGTPVRFGGTVQDIDALKQTELKLLDAVELNTIMQFIATAANETNTLDEAFGRIGELLLAHPDWDRGVAFDVTPEGLTVRPIPSEDTPLPTELERVVAARALDERGTVLEEHAVPEKPMVGFPVLCNGEPIVVVVITNVSPFVRHDMVRSMVDQVAGQLAQVAAREAAADELAAARDLAMAASQAKSDFLATMSHEIRTPLNGVIGLNDLLLRTELDQQQRQLAEAMQGAGRNLLALISDVLDFSKIEAGGLELEAVAFQPAVVVQGTLELFAPMADAKGIDLVVEIADDVPERLEGDPSRLGQVVSNLVANAVKFTHEGSVRVQVSATTVGRSTTLRLVVRDTGIGMDPEQRGRIFQPFRQADASTTRNFGGTGLGLAIAHRLATALGGEIGVESVLGEGSTFWFTGQFRVADARPRPAVRPVKKGAEPGPGGHVLVVEDNEVNQLVAVGMLEVLGYSCEVAADGAAAAARAAGGRFDAVLMDLQMPRVDGYAATRLIRQAEPPGVRIPIIALTASATAGEQERCLAAGMTGFLSKPVGVEALARVLREQVSTDDSPAYVHPVGAALVPAPATALDLGRLDELAEMGAAAFPLIHRAIENFVGAADGNLGALRAAVASGDAGALRSAAHRLKGSAANLGAVRVADIAFELETRAETDDLSDVDDLLCELETALDEASAVLRDYRLEAASADEACSA